MAEPDLVTFLLFCPFVQTILLVFYHLSFLKISDQKVTRMEINEILGFRKNRKYQKNVNVNHFELCQKSLFFNILGNFYK